GLLQRDGLAEEGSETRLNGDRRELLDAFDRDPAEVEELEDRGTCLGDGENSRDDGREDSHRDDERSSGDGAPAHGRRLADSPEDGLIQLRLRRPLEAGAEIAQGELELRHTPPPPFARAGARARARAWI